MPKCFVIQPFNDKFQKLYIDVYRDAISDAELELAKSGYEINPPQSKEALMYRRIFDAQFPKEACAKTVPGGKSIACSSPAASAWDASFANAADPSGRAVKGVHEKAL